MHSINIIKDQGEESASSNNLRLSTSFANGVFSWRLSGLCLKDVVQAPLPALAWKVEVRTVITLVLSRDLTVCTALPA